MRDRIVLTMEQQKEIDARVNVAYPEFGSVYQKNLPLLHFDFVSVLNIEDQDLDIKNLTRFDVDDYEKNADFIILTMEAPKFFKIRLQILLTEGDEGKWKAFPDSEFYTHVTKAQGNTIISSIMTMFFELNAFILLFNPQDVYDIEEKVCKKAQWQELKKSYSRQNDEVRLFRCYTLKKTWKSAKPHKPHVIKCPAWGVRGYYKTVNGKQIFVKPYVKGKDKENYKGKEYKLLPKTTKKEK